MPSGNPLSCPLARSSVHLSPPSGLFNMSNMGIAVSPHTHPSPHPPPVSLLFCNFTHLRTHLTKSSDSERARPWKSGTEPTPVHLPMHNPHEWTTGYRTRPSASSLPGQCAPETSSKRNGNPPTRRLLHHLHDLVAVAGGTGNITFALSPLCILFALKACLRAFRASVHHPVLVH